MLGRITYNVHSRYRLGNEPVSLERFEEITRGVERGDLIGLPVYAYVHSGETIATTAFSCPFDSGRSGWVYCDRLNALKKFKTVADVQDQLRKDVIEFDRKVLNSSVEEDY